MEIKFRVSETQRGLIIMAGGLLLLLQSMNFLAAGLNALIIIAALGMIAYGFMHAGLDSKFQSLVSKGEKKIEKGGHTTHHSNSNDSHHKKH